MPSPESTFFIDSSFHVSYKFEGQEHHQESRNIIRGIREQYTNPTFITTNLVFSETISLITCREVLPKKLRHKYAMDLGEDILRFNIVHAFPPEMLLDTWGLFYERANQGYGWSFVDCSCFIFIREIRKHKYNPRFTIKKVLAYDKHFDAAQGEFGFKVIKS